MRVVLYTDGNCLNNQRGKGKGGFAAYLIAGKHRRLIAGYQEGTTNNEMEIMGLLFGLSKLKTPCHVVWYSDSRYCIDSATKWSHGWKKKGWKKKKNKEIRHVELWKRIRDLIDSQLSFEGHWVPGHAGVEGNEVCDRACNRAIERKEGYDTGLVFGVKEEELEEVF